eukprot:6792222-Pyramimonas_sp.AAC.1
MMLAALAVSCILKHSLSNHVLGSVKRAFDMFSGFAWMSALARKSSSLTTTARCETEITYTRMVVTRSGSNSMRCCSNETTFDISVVRHSSTYGQFSSESSP